MMNSPARRNALLIIHSIREFASSYFGRVEEAAFIRKAEVSV
jgi:hypothetical protein